MPKMRAAQIGRSNDKEPLAKKLAAFGYIDTAASDPAQELQKSGGARAILATAPDSKSIAALVGALGPNGKLLVVAASA